MVAPGDLRAMTALMLLAPATPMLFQGQEFGSTRPFLYFADHDAELAAQVAAGRRKFLAQFPSLATPENQQRIARSRAPRRPSAPASSTGARARATAAPTMWQLHRDLLALAARRSGVCAARRRTRARRGAGSAVAVAAHLRRRPTIALLLVNYGADQPLVPAPEPLLAPPAGRRWRLIWSSEDARYGGRGTPPVETDEDGWRLPGHCAVVMAPGEP